MGPEELFATFYQQRHGHDPSQAVLVLFRRLYGEEAVAAS